MKVVYDPTRQDFMVGKETLREFYVRKRKESGMKVSQVEYRAGLSHPALQNLEKPQGKVPGWRSAHLCLVGLEILGIQMFVL